MLELTHPLLYVDFDGVLHPDEVHLYRKRGLVLEAEGSLMMHAAYLEDALAPYPDVKLILSTSWVRILGFSNTMKRLPASLRARVVGATWHSQMVNNVDSAPYSVGYGDPFDALTRFQQVYQHVTRHQVKHWLALDDLHSGSETWPEQHKDNLVLTAGLGGIREPSALLDLTSKLSELRAARLGR